MKYLIDSHVYIWLLAKSYKVGPKTQQLLEKSTYSPILSVASLWELGLKSSKGRLELTEDMLNDGITKLGVEMLDVQLNHVFEFSKKNTDHTDPFDLMLCSQAKSEGIVLVTADKTLLKQFPDSINACL